MFYIHVENPGTHNRLVINEGPIPKYSNSQILVKVMATALNHADLLQKHGKYPPPPGESDIPGLELAGEVVAVGAEVTQFKIGDRVYGLVGSGAYAEFCAVEAVLAHIIPTSWSYQKAAALPEALTTVYATLFDLGDLKAGQTLLVHGAGSGIGSLAIQMAKLSNVKVITTVGDHRKVDKALNLGADQVIRYKDHNFEDLIEENSVDLILDFIGGSYFNRHLHLLKSQGKLIQIACLRGSSAECNLALILRKRLEIHGFVLRPQTIIEKAKLWSLAHEEWFEAFAEGKLSTVIDSTFKFAEIEQAQQYMESSRHFGKIVIVMD